MKEARTYGRVGRLHKYIFRKDWSRFLDDIRNIPGGTVSRPAAAALLGCSRQRIHQLIDTGTVRCWEFEEGWPKTQLAYSEVSVLDLLEHAQRAKRPIASFEAMKYVEWTPEVEGFFRQKDNETAHE